MYSNINDTTHDTPRGGMDLADTLQDGLLELMCGVTFILAGGLMLADLGALLGVLPAAWIPLWPAMRKASLKRMGVDAAAVSDRQKIRMAMLISLLVGILLFIFALGLYSFTGDGAGWLPSAAIDWLGMNFPLFLGAGIALVIALTGGILQISRLYAYALWILAVFWAGHLRGIEPPLYFILAGAGLALAGAALLARFLRRYPARQDG
jgi:hypothetical protein